MNVVFTICSNNYLAQAKTLGDSYLDNNQGKFYIFLCDDYSNAIDYDFFNRFELISIKNIGLYDLESLSSKYGIIELNTSVKASCFKYLRLNNSKISNIIYLDPDIAVYSDLSFLFKELDTNDLLLTPHLLNPVPLDDMVPSENLYLNYGMFNLGFIGLSLQTQNVSLFLDWWEERLMKRCFIDLRNGYFVDQLWLNWAPIFFEKVKILKNYSLNVAPWNLHERPISKKENDYWVLGSEKLTFFHFSSYNYQEPKIYSRHYNRFIYNDLAPTVNELYRDYHKKLLDNRVEILSKIDYVFGVKPTAKKKPNIYKRLSYLLLPRLIYRLLKRMLTK